MRAIRLHGARDLRLTDEPEPVAAPGETLLQVNAVGICGSDLHWFVDGGIGDTRISQPVVPGHEFGGMIAAGARRGERVAVDPHIPCDRCRYCLAGWPNLCPTGRFSGQGTLDGPLRELMTWPSHLLYPVPDEIPDDQVPLLEPLLIAMHADYLHPVRRGDAVAVVGCGPLGLLQAQVACLSEPGRLVVTDPVEHRRKAALGMGASEALDLPAPAGPAESREAPFESMDVVFEASGQPDAVDVAVALARPGGTVVLLGIPDEDKTQFMASVARRKGLTLKLVRRSVPRYEQALRLIASGRIRLDGLVSHRFGLEETETAFGVASRREGLKVAILPRHDERP
jgi:L-iditol 2-dehydrogenase